MVKTIVWCYLGALGNDALKDRRLEDSKGGQNIRANGLAMMTYFPTLICICKNRWKRLGESKRVCGCAMVLLGTQLIRAMG